MFTNPLGFFRSGAFPETTASMVLAANRRMNSHTYGSLVLSGELPNPVVIMGPEDGPGFSDSDSLQSYVQEIAQENNRQFGEGKWHVIFSGKNKESGTIAAVFASQNIPVVGVHFDGEVLTGDFLSATVNLC